MTSDKLYGILKQYGVNSPQYRNAYNTFTGGKGTIVKTKEDDTIIAPTLDEVIVTPSAKDKGDLIASKVSKAMNKSGNIAMGIGGATLAAPFIIGSASTALPIIKSTILDTGKFLISNPEVSREIVKDVLVGSGVDLGYETITKKPAQLGEALDIKNPYGRTVLNFISPGSIIGGSLINGSKALPIKPKISLPTNKDVDTLYKLCTEYAKLRNIQIPKKLNNVTPRENIDILENWAKKYLKKESFFRGVDINKNTKDFITKYNLDTSSEEALIRDLVSRVPPNTGAGRKGLTLNTDKSFGSYASDSFQEAKRYALNPETLIKSENPYIAVLKRRYDFSRSPRELLEEALRIDYNIPEISNVDKLLKAKTQSEFMRILKNSTIRNPLGYSNTEQKLLSLGKRPRQLNNLKRIVKNTPNNYFIVQPTKKGLNNYVNIGNEGDIVWDVSKIINIKNNLKTK